MRRPDDKAPVNGTTGESSPSAVPTSGAALDDAALSGPGRFVHGAAVFGSDAELLAVALDAANRAAALFPKSAAVFNLKGSVESRLLQFTDAVASYRHALQLDRTNANSILGLARAQASAGQTSDATSTFHTAIQRFPKDARIKVAYAEILLKQMETGDSDAKSRAEQLLRSAIAIDALNGEALYQLGNVELNDGRSEEALRHLEQAVKLLPQSICTTS